MHGTLQRKHRGFTLIELMIVVLVIAIIGAIAYPSYRDYTEQARRSDAQNALLRWATLQEKYYADCHKYASNLEGTAASCADDELGLGSAAPESPEGYYIGSVSVGNIDGDCTVIDCGYILTATPKAGGPQDGDGPLRIDSTGKKQWKRDDGASWVSWNEK